MPRKKAQSVKAIEKPSGENEGAESLLHARKCMHASWFTWNLPINRAEDHEVTSARKKANLKKAVESTADLIEPTGACDVHITIMDNSLNASAGPRRAKVDALDNAG